MFKKLTNMLHSDKTSEKSQIEPSQIAWKKSSKKLDGVVPRRRALKQIGIKIKKSLPVKKTSVVSRKPLRQYLRVFSIDGHAHLLYIKNKELFIKSLNSSGRFKTIKKITVSNSFRYEIPVDTLFNINATQFSDDLVLTYQREDLDNRIMAFADSVDVEDFREKFSTKTLKQRFVFANTDQEQGKYSIYIGENFIHFATSDSLMEWDIQKEYLLTPRQKFFDHNGIKIIETISLKEGKLLLYESSFEKDGRLYLQVGGALFETANPNQLVWRSEEPIWEQSFVMASENDQYSPLGAVYRQHKIFIYYVISGDLMRADFAVPEFRFKEDKIITISRYEKNPVILPRKENSWESKSTFNAAAIHAEGKFHLIYRAVGDNDVSSLGYASSENGFDFDRRCPEPVYVPREEFEGVMQKNRSKKDSQIVAYESGGGCCGGCEDPRLTRIGDTIYMTYVAYSGRIVPGVAISSIAYDDFINHRWNWTKAHLISKAGQMQKNWMLFPEKINGKFAVIHSITPRIMIDYFDNMDEDRGYIENSFRQTDTQENRWDNIVRGAGAPPIRTKYGWLLFYHAMDKQDPNRYKIGAMLLDITNPEKILYRSREPILAPDEKYENEGLKAGVVYVCGAVVENNRLYIYYGGADMVMCVATANLDDFLERLVMDRQSLLKKTAA